MKKALFIFISIIGVTLVVGCSSSVTYSKPVIPTGYAVPKKEYNMFDSFGYDVEGEDLNALAEVLYASDELYGAYRLFDSIGIDSKALDKGLHLNEYRKQWTRIKSGLNVYLDYSENPDRYYFFLEKHVLGSHSTIPLGSRGPAGGFVFYDCDADNDYGNSDGLKSSECGWRFLEAAPYDIKQGSVERFMWGDDGKYEYGTQTGIGTGKTNTAIIVSEASNSRNPNAATLCNDYTYRGYDDWFLPSKDELNLMYTNLRKASLGGFAYNYYWSSSESSGSSGYAWGHYFVSGSQGNYYRNHSFGVRPVRAF